MRAVPAETLLLAVACAVGAFATIAAYEIVVVRYVKHCIGRARPIMTALIAFPLGHAAGQTVLSGSALRYRMYAPAGFTAMEVGATVLLCGLPYVLAFGLLLDLALVFGAEPLGAAVPAVERVAVCARLHRARQGRGVPAVRPPAQGPDPPRWLGRARAAAAHGAAAAGGRHRRHRAGLVDPLPAAAGVGADRVPALPGDLSREHPGRRAEPRAGRSRRARIDAAAAAAAGAARAAARRGAACTASSTR